MKKAHVLFILAITLFTSVSFGKFVYRTGENGNGWISKVSDANGLKVVWWNLGACSHPDQNHNLSGENLLENIETLLDNPSLKPDILILGEYCPAGVREEKEGTLEFLQLHYPHMKMITRYTPFHGEGDKTNGIRIFSRFEMNNLSAHRLPASGAWLNSGEMDQCVKKMGDSSYAEPGRYRFPYLQFDVEKGGRKFNVVTTHFPNPWPIYEQCIGKLKAGLKLLYGSHNPNYEHAVALTNAFRDADRTLVIGDSNAPKLIQKKIKLLFFSITLNFVSHSYKRLRSIFGSSIVSSNAGTNFSSFGSFSIDHAFASGDIKTRYAAPIPLAGSDHIPIYVVIQ